MTHFTVLERFGDCTLLELQLETGRTHQIRVHMKFIGHPLVGDPIYGRSKGTTMNGQALHAAVLGFVHPSTGEYKDVQCADSGGYGRTSIYAAQQDKYKSIDYKSMEQPDLRHI